MLTLENHKKKKILEKTGENLPLSVLTQIVGPASFYTFFWPYRLRDEIRKPEKERQILEKTGEKLLTQTAGPGRFYTFFFRLSRPSAMYNLEMAKRGFEPILAKHASGHTRKPGEDLHQFRRRELSWAVKKGLRGVGID